MWLPRKVKAKRDALEGAERTLLSRVRGWDLNPQKQLIRSLRVLPGVKSVYAGENSVSGRGGRRCEQHLGSPLHKHGDQAGGWEGGMSAKVNSQVSSSDASIVAAATSEDRSFQKKNSFKYFDIPHQETV